MIIPAWKYLFLIPGNIGIFKNQSQVAEKTPVLAIG
jgi:hypothetical protein